MAAIVKGVTLAVMVCMVVVETEAALSCGTVTSKLGPCMGYLSKGGKPSPACCAGVRGLNGLARNTPDRQQACRCLQTLARKMGYVSGGRASALPGACGVTIPYPISLSTNCNNVK